MSHQILNLKGVHPTPGYSHAARTGNLLFIAGQIPKGTSRRTPHRTSPAAPARRGHSFDYSA